MRTVERFAFFFGIANLVLGVLAMFTPFASRRRNGFLGRILPQRRSGLFNSDISHLFGNFGAVNPPHAIMHSALGAAGLATRPFSRISRAYMWMNAILFGALAVMGWATVGFKPGVQKVKGVALDRGGNILHTLWAVGSLLLAIKPNLGRARIDNAIDDLVEAGLRE